ncbi:putative holin-like toxin [Gordoniibacillus kamchatkensis]
MDAKDTLTIMIGFGTLLIALLTLVLNIVVALFSRKRK